MIAHGVDQDRIRNVEALLNAGANPNVADLRGQTPLHVAAMRGIPELVAILVHRGALLYKDFKGRTPLDIARHKGLSGSALDLLTKLKRGVGDLATAALESLQKAIVTAQGVEDGQIEGLRRSTLLSVIERNPKNRAAAIQAHGDKCMVCGFHFESVYGSLGRGYIEVHHCTPLSSLSRGRKINPKREMAVLCANCHRMIHRRVTPILSVAELKRQLT
jgi:predicted HNH restriction endonuclease